MRGHVHARPASRWAWPLAQAALLIGGVALLAGLQRCTPEGVFYNGDGGTKYLLARQYAAGLPGPALQLEGPDWAQGLWRAGQQPLGPQFVFRRGERLLIAFPVLFPWLSAWALRWFGFDGLLLLPGLATVATWLLVLGAARRLRLSAVATLVALALAIFGTPLAVYGAIFWEHAPAVTLAFAGLVLLSSPRRPAPSARTALLAGLLVGLSMWLREELLALVVVLALLAGAAFLGGATKPGAIVRHTRALQMLGLALPERMRRGLRALSWPRATSAAVLAGLALGLVGYVALNVAIYSSPWGVRDVQLPTDYWWQRPRGAWGVLAFVVPAFVGTFPLALLWPWPWRRGRWPRWARRLTVVAVAFVLLMAPLPLIPGGKQIGARYLLVLYPVAAILAGAAWDVARRRGRTGTPPGRLWRAGVSLATLVLAGLCVAEGSWRAPRDLAVALRKRALAVEHLRSDPQRVVAVSHPFAAQQLAWYIGPRLFFLTRRGADLKALAEAQAAAGRGVGFTYLCNPAYACPGFEEEPRQRRLRLPRGGALLAVRQTDVGPYLRWYVSLAAPGLLTATTPEPAIAEPSRAATTDGQVEPAD